jgi:HK97 family phage major capsid protein
VQAEQRAMSTTDTAGGFLIPLTLDPAVSITGNGSTNPLRAISRVVQTVTDTWNGVTAAGVVSEWTAEAAEMADASPTFGSPSIPVYKGDAFVPFSFEVGGDAVNFMQELGMLLQDGADQLTATAYTTGSGRGQPTGVITKLVASAGSVPLIPAATPETLTASDVFNVQNAMPPRFQPRPVWHGNLSILNSIRALETTNGAIRFPKLQSNPPMLLSRSVYENSNMDGSLNPAATENNYVLLYGDFAAGMVIVDRFGSTLELVPQLFGSNRRPARRTFVVPHRLRRGDSERTDAVDSDDGLTGRPRNAVPAGNGAAPYRRPVQPLPVPVGVCCATSTRTFRGQGVCGTPQRFRKSTEGCRMA